MEKFLVIYKIRNSELNTHFEGYEFEGTLNEVIEDATANKRHLNYDREGVKVFKITEAVFEDFS